MFHLGWFLGNGFGIQAWNPAGGDGPFVGSNMRDWMKPDIYVDLAASLERAGFDYILIEDTAMVEDSFAGSADTSLRRGFMAPKNDPMPLVPLMTQRTKHIGVIPTVSTIQYPPYLAARLYNTLDHLTEGRVGMNVVTSVTDRVAQNYGHDQHFDHDERYLMAQEWIDVVRQLQNTWDRDAIVGDDVNGIYADHTKVHPINFEGKYFRSRGPLNTIPGPQREIPIASAGGSPPGRDLAARFDDTMLAMCKTVEDMKAYRVDMHRRMLLAGRKPTDIKLLYLATPIVAATDAEAQDRAEALRQFRYTDPAVEYNLWNMTYTSGGRIDFGAFDLDTPVEEIDLSKGNGEQSSLANLFQDSAGKTLREIAGSSFQITDLGLVGSPDTVAGKMEEIMDEVGGDGFLIYSPTTRISIAEIADGLAPALRKRGLIRDGYDYSTLRENLLEF
ncbi:FMNH2-dependent monooxygenase [Rhodococcus sp. 06-156-3C]|uniref:NtaA/DmoA family FMN-dependent monooxygenase n=1 Tax=Nocardiaceae TaxID=85025 RepID=UPI000370610B|nr:MULTISPECIES: NtaA/DmoA family FMN-dependent monooxygenase [Rhodococcus]OZD11021.1 FMNH2-dependent monooxygenase [Rhodococcus sp. 06-156-4C]OZD14436.1 FMNH2-dependent monooxygenase [Rhodococcus sp. 06-156-4a]OZD24770.1 FMNH2-dependent monooxygenase [Rhodococcus sp. 06-156-3C]OZD27744.1 FMNH2-dependent monooxygenase [Rhodococcus sp. 06-156-3b]OZD39725.1 FMNH2-dependent monooxygenase [Rhodococcus sp. 06-156-3]